MPPQRSLGRRLLLAVAAACAGAAACDDATGPAPPPGAVLRLAGPDSVFVSRAHADPTAPNAGRRVECTVALEASASEASVTIDSARLAFAPVAGGQPGTLSLTAAELASLWGSVIPAGGSRAASMRLHDAAPFSVRTDVWFHAEGAQPQVASATVRCVAPLVGTYVLTSINDVRPPATSVVYPGLVADTLTFREDLTYTARGQRDGSYLVTPPRPYDVAGDTLRIPELLPGVAGGAFVRAGTTLAMRQERCCGWPPYAWRFDVLGSTPALPPAPGFALSRTTVRFAARQGGPLPPPDTVFITSAGERPLSGITASSGSGCLNNLCPSDWGSWSLPQFTAPTSIRFSVRRTDIPVGTYTNTVFLSASDVPGGAVINVEYTVSAP